MHLCDFCCGLWVVCDCIFVLVLCMCISKSLMWLGRVFIALLRSLFVFVIDGFIFVGFDCLAMSSFWIFLFRPRHFWVILVALEKGFALLGRFIGGVCVGCGLSILFFVFFCLG